MDGDARHLDFAWNGDFLDARMKATANVDLVGTAQLAVRAVTPRVHLTVSVQGEAKEKAKGHSLDSGWDPVQRHRLRVEVGTRTAVQLTPKIQEVLRLVARPAVLIQDRRRTARGALACSDGCHVAEPLQGLRPLLVRRARLDAQRLVGATCEDLSSLGGVYCLLGKEQGVLAATGGSRDPPGAAGMHRHLMGRPHGVRAGPHLPEEPLVRGRLVVVPAEVQHGARLPAVEQVAHAQLPAAVSPARKGTTNFSDKDHVRAAHSHGAHRHAGEISQQRALVGCQPLLRVLRDTV
mmetsp:Transcript_39139/g.101174  ORF Transcript_39139/g.101174 Transcript_39139/m.101174 type:complete len:293 (+) Transcript_39139:822-1700(+)